MKERHIATIAARSRRVDLRANPPSLVVRVPNHINYSGCVNQIARIDVNGKEAGHTLLDRATARLHEVPPEGALVSLYWVFPADWCHRLMVHLRDEETDEVFTKRMVRLSRRDTSTNAPPLVAGLQPAEGTYRNPDR